MELKFEQVSKNYKEKSLKRHFRPSAVSAYESRIK